MKTVLTMICNLFKPVEVSKEAIRARIKQDAENGIKLNWYYQAN